MQFLSKIIFFSTIILASTLSAPTLADGNIGDAFKNGSPALNFRLRYENAKQQGLKDANATTLRSTLGFETADFYKTIFNIELVDVSHLFGLHYNPGVSDLSLPQYSLIADPPGAGITEMKLSYTGFAKNIIILGRQYIQLDNERFIGKNDFRQYPQSFDAISLNNTMLNNIDFYYAYILYVNTNYSNGRAIQGRRQLSTNIINIDWTEDRFGKIGGYIYLNNDKNVNTNSNATLGASIRSPIDLTATDGYAYYLEAALQKAKFNNPIQYTAHYAHCYLAKTIEIFTATLGYELLSGNAHDTNKAFITPLGSVDNFNGDAEAFTNTPARGLQDTYASLVSTTHNINVGITYHFFRLDKGPGSKSAGQEFDIYANFGITDRIALNLGYAKYYAQNNVALSTQRCWLMLTANTF